MKWSAAASVRAFVVLVVLVVLATLPGLTGGVAAQQASPPSPRTPAAQANTVARQASPAQATAIQQGALPTPESVLGFRVGADYKLATYEQSIAYFKALAAASDRLKLLDVGTTSFGRTWYLAVISSPANLAKLEHYRDIAQRLAHPAGLTDDSAHALAREGRAFVDISGGLHASEVAGAQHTIALAYDLLSRANDPDVKQILDNDVLFLWPSLNPDGQDIVVDWYRRNVGTPYEASPLYTLWEKYVGHDNNRDAYMLNTIESRVITRTWRHWEPQIIHVHHQSSPFPTRIWLPPFSEPVSPDVNALMAREVNTIGMTMAQELESRGQPGATSMGLAFDAWYPGYLDYLPMLKNSVAYWTETAGYRYATPYFYTLRDFPKNMRDLRPQSLYSSPWKGGWWRLKDAVDYMLTASEAVLGYAARYREEVLYNRYQAGRDAIRKFQHQPPYAYVVPQHQRDAMAAAALLRRLAFNGIRVDQLTRQASVDGMTYPAGTWVIPMDQEFAELAKAVLEVQHYPDLREYPKGPPSQPYDAAGWTLGYQMGVRVITAHSPLSDSTRAAMRPVRGKPVNWHTVKDAPFDTDSVAAGIAPPPGRITGSGAWLELDPAQNETFRLINRVLAAGGAVHFQAGHAGADGAPGAGGHYLVGGVSVNRVDAWSRALALDGARTGRVGGAAVRPRIAIYHPWTASMDEGWTRWLFDQYGFAYARIHNADIRAGGLRDRFDVIILADISPRTIMNGYAPGTVPGRYAGGVGEAGVRALDAFVRAGGTLVCMNHSSAFAIEQLHLPVKNVVADLPHKTFFASGSLLQVITDPAHPVMAGMPDRAAIFFDDSPVFTTLAGFHGAALAKYADDGSPLLSGYLLGADKLQGYAAALDVDHGDGHVVLLGFRPQWRGQPWGTFRVLFNAAFYGGTVARQGGGTPGFWVAPAGGEEPAPAGARPTGSRGGI